MANSNATLKLNLSYAGPGNTLVTIPTVTTVCPYQGSCEGDLDVPDAEAMGTAHDVPFGSVAKATMVMLFNACGQDLEVSINAGSTSYKLPAGGVLCLAQPELPGDTELSAVQLTTTASQSGPGKITFFVFGDPV